MINDNKLYHRRIDPLLDPVLFREESWKLVVPAELKLRVLKEAHDTPCSAHLGVEKTFNRLVRDYYWRGMYYDVVEYIRTCDVCQKYKSSKIGRD